MLEPTQGRCDPPIDWNGQTSGVTFGRLSRRHNSFGVHLLSMCVTTGRKTPQPWASCKATPTRSSTSNRYRSRSLFDLPQSPGLTWVAILHGTVVPRGWVSSTIDSRLTLSKSLSLPIAIDCVCGGMYVPYLLFLHTGR